MMETSYQREVVFFRVLDNQTKLWRIYTTIQQHFAKGERVVVTLPNQQAEKYLDEVLWNITPESFLPHTKTSEPCEARIVFTKVKKNLNRATITWNLCPEITPLYEQCTRVYELLDETSEEKARQAANKLTAYKDLGLQPLLQ